MPNSSKQRCKQPSVFSHLSNDIPKGTQMWTEPNIILGEDNFQG